MLDEGDNNQRNPYRGVKLEFPHFKCDNPAGWVFKATQYFEFHQTSPAHNLLMVSYHTEGQAMVRYQDALNTGQFT